MKRILAFFAAAAFGVTVVLPAAAFAEPEQYAPVQTAMVAVDPQTLAAQPGDAAGVIRDGYTIEAPKPAPVMSTGFTATVIPGLLTTWPCGGSPNEGYGPRGEGFHYGVDVMCGYGSANVATGPGVVIETTDDGGSWGSYVKIDHGNGVATLCAHMVAGSFTVGVGQIVAAGDMIGLVGTTGNTTAPHCHFEVWVNGARVDPVPWLP